MLPFKHVFFSKTVDKPLSACVTLVWFCNRVPEVLGVWNPKSRKDGKKKNIALSKLQYLKHLSIFGYGKGIVINVSHA